MAKIGQRELRNLKDEIAMVEKEKEAWTGYVEDIDTRMEKLQLDDTNMDERVVRRKNRELLRAEEEMRSGDIREDRRNLDRSTVSHKTTEYVGGQSVPSTTAPNVTTQSLRRNVSPDDNLKPGDDSVNLYEMKYPAVSTPSLRTQKTVQKSASFSEDLDDDEGGRPTFPGYDASFERLHSKPTLTPHEKVVAIGGSTMEPQLPSQRLASHLGGAFGKENVTSELRRKMGNMSYQDVYGDAGTPAIGDGDGFKSSAEIQRLGDKLDTNGRGGRTEHNVQDTYRLPSFLETPADQDQTPAKEAYGVTDSSVRNMRYLMEERMAEERLAQLKREEIEVEQRVRDRVLYLKRKEQEMELENHRLREEERTRLSRLQAIESKQQHIEDNWRRDYTLMKKKEEELAMEQRRQDIEEQKRIERMCILERRRKQMEEEQREKMLMDLKANEDRRERVVRERLLIEQDQKDQLQRHIIEERKREQEVQDQHDRLVNWEVEIKKQQEKIPTTDRLQMLFEAEQGLAHAIQEELQKHEEEQKNVEQIRTDQSGGRLDNNTCTINREGPGNVYVKPTVTPFSGTEPIPKNECSFEIWTLEVECIMDTYPDYLVSQAIRQSLRGDAKRVLLPLGPHATAQAIIEKMESVFGNVVSGESVLQQFYSSRQTDRETVTTWGLRLEGILQKAIRKGQIQQEQRNEMLGIKFWRGLYSDELRNATRMYFETERDFEVLRKKVRSEECEIETNRKESKTTRTGKESQETIQQQQIQLNKDQSMFADLLSRMEKMEQKMDNMNKGRGQGGPWNSRQRNRKPDAQSPVLVPEQKQKRPDGSLN